MSVVADGLRSKQDRWVRVTWVTETDLSNCHSVLYLHFKKSFKVKSQLQSEGWQLYVMIVLQPMAVWFVGDFSKDGLRSHVSYCELAFCRPVPE